jgi:hypothetical protein
MNQIFKTSKMASEFSMQHAMSALVPHTQRNLNAQRHFTRNYNIKGYISPNPSIFLQGRGTVTLLMLAWFLAIQRNGLRETRLASYHIMFHQGICLWLYLLPFFTPFTFTRADYWMDDTNSSILYTPLTGVTWAWVRMPDPTFMTLSINGSATIIDLDRAYNKTL